MFSLAMWLGGGMLYIWIISLIFYRYTFFTMSPSDLAPPYWINMGAAAISTLAGTMLVAAAPHSPALEQILPFLRGFTLDVLGDRDVVDPDARDPRDLAPRLSASSRCATIRSTGARCSRSACTRCARSGCHAWSTRGSSMESRACSSTWRSARGAASRPAWSGTCSAGLVARPGAEDFVGRPARLQPAFVSCSTASSAAITPGRLRFATMRMAT